MCNILCRVTQYDVFWHFRMSSFRCFHLWAYALERAKSKHPGELFAAGAPFRVLWSCYSEEWLDLIFWVKGAAINQCHHNKYTSIGDISMWFIQCDFMHTDFELILFGTLQSQLLLLNSKLPVLRLSRFQAMTTKDTIAKVRHFCILCMIFFSFFLICFGLKECQRTSMFAPFFSRLSCFFPACVLQFLLAIAVGFHMFSHLFWVFSYVRERQERLDTRDTYPPCRPPLLAWALQLEPLWLWPFRRRSASRFEFNESSYIYWKTITFRRCQFHLFSQDTFRTLLVEFQWFSRVRPTLDQFDLVQQQAGTQCTQVTIARVFLFLATSTAPQLNVLNLQVSTSIEKPKKLELEPRPVLRTGTEVQTSSIDSLWLCRFAKSCIKSRFSCSRHRCGPGGRVTRVSQV